MKTATAPLYSIFRWGVGRRVTRNDGITDPLRNVTKNLLRSWQSALLSTDLDNIIFRHEVGIDSFGRLRRDSPVVAVHLTMLALTFLLPIIFLVRDWQGVFAASGLVLAGMTLGTYPFAYRRGFLSIRRERLAGTLEQLYMTSLTHNQLFEGKFFGVMAPFFEARRYMLPLSLAFCAASWFVIKGPYWTASIVFALIAMNHIGYSAYIGVLAGLRAGCRGSRSSLPFIQDWDLSPGLTHIQYLLKYSLFLLLPIAFLFFLGGWAMYSAFALMTLIPYCAAIRLRDRQQLERERISRNFKSVFNFDLVS